MTLSTWNLPSNSRADFSFGIFEEFHECGYQITSHGFFIYSFRNLCPSQPFFLG